MGGDKKLDIKTLETQTTNLTDEQNEQLALDAIAEAEAEEKKAKDEVVIPDEVQKDIDEQKKKEEAAKPKEGEPSEEEKAAQKKKEEEDKQKEEERILNAKEEELSEEDKAKKPEIVKVREETKNKSVEEEVQAYAKEMGVPIEEAREDLKSIASIQEKYKGDPKQLAKANLHIQRLYSKTQEELKSLKDAKPAEQPAHEVTIEAVMKYMEDGKTTTKDGKPVTKEQIIAAYREANLDLETLDDEAIFVRAAKEYQSAINKSIVEAQAQLGPKAKEKRETLFNSLPEADKKFLPEIKPLIEKLPDAQVMNESFDIGTYITYAKGKLFDTTIQQLEKDKKDFGDKEYKRGVEEAKILGTQETPDGKPPKSKDITLTDKQKARAREMFDNKDITDEQAYQLYADLLKDGYKEE